MTRTINYLIAVAGITLLLLVLYGSPARSAPIEVLNRMDIEMFDPSVQITTAGGSVCSGTIIASTMNETAGKYKNLVLTAKHCVSNPKQTLNINVYDQLAQGPDPIVISNTGNVLAGSPDSDLAAIIFESPGMFNAAVIAPRDAMLRFGQDVWSVSFPLGNPKTLTEGTLGYIDLIDGVGEDKVRPSASGRFQKATPGIAPGSSGSALFALIDGEYKLIGVATGATPPFDFNNFYTPLDEIRDFVGDTFEQEINKAETP